MTTPEPIEPVDLPDDTPAAAPPLPTSRRSHHQYHADRRRKAGGRPQPGGSQHPSGATLAQAPEAGERNLVVCQSNGQFLGEVEPSEINELLAQPGNFTWLDLQNPHEHDLVLLREEFNFHPLAIEDATRRFERPKIDSYENYYFLVFYGVRFDEASDEIIAEAMHLFIGKNFLVSVHAGPMPAIGQTIARWRRREEQFGNNVGALVYALLDAIVDDYFPVIDVIADRVDDVEERMFSRFDLRVQQEIFQLKRNLLAMRRVVSPERDVLNVLIRREASIIEADTVIYIQDVYDHLMRVTDSIDTYRDMLSSALDVFLSLQSNQLNQILKVLTVTSIILMSAALIAGIYGMNFEYMPELGWRYGYPFALGLMVTAAGGLLWLFRRLRWI